MRRFECEAMKQELKSNGFHVTAEFCGECQCCVERRESLEATERQHHDLQTLYGVWALGGAFAIIAGTKTMPENQLFGFFMEGGQ
jgi:hypothetical protein